MQLKLASLPGPGGWGLGTGGEREVHVLLSFLKESQAALPRHSLLPLPAPSLLPGSCPPGGPHAVAHCAQWDCRQGKQRHLGSL